MRKIFIALLLMVGLAFGQYDLVNWGAKIEFGTQFEDTDSLRLKAYYVTDSLYLDTLYSAGINISGSGHEGIYCTAAYFAEVSGTSASMAVDVRFGDSFYDRSGNNMVWEDTWHTIYSCKKDTLYKLYISPSDSSWFMPSTHKQYRLREADADTVLHYITDYNR